MIYDATLKKVFRVPPNLLLSQVLQKEVVAARILPTDLITVENLHPDLLFETADGELIHAELQGYGMPEFACRNLIYFALLIRDYGKAPTQVVFWIGPRRVGVTDGLSIPDVLDYKYRVIDVRDIDAGPLLEYGSVEESIFAILCRLGENRQEAVRRILLRIGELPVELQREAIAQLLILSGLRGLQEVVKEEVKKMPVTIDIHENQFLEEIYQEGIEKGLEKGLEEGTERGVEMGKLEIARSMLSSLLAEKFGPLPASLIGQIGSAGLADLEAWSRRLIRCSRLDDVFRT